MAKNGNGSGNGNENENKYELLGSESIGTKTRDKWRPMSKLNRSLSVAVDRFVLRITCHTHVRPISTDFASTATSDACARQRERVIKICSRTRSVRVSVVC